jgi:hypothetical protein
VRITKDGKEFKKYSDYNDMNVYMWKSQQMPRNYIPADEKMSVWEQFLLRLAGVWTYNEDGTRTTDPTLQRERMEVLYSYIGYLLHAFFDTKLFAINFTDMHMDEDGEANGRSGKTLLGQGIGKMLNPNTKDTAIYTEISGRDFSHADLRKYDACNIDTKLVHLNDLPKKFDVEKIFNLITEGVQVQKIYKAKFLIRAKIILSSNQTLYIKGESAKDRIMPFEISDYYYSGFGPDDEFKHWFFSDWDDAEWARFDEFMQSCVQYYLRYGVLKTQGVNLNRRTVRDHTDNDFVVWMDYQFAEKDYDGNQNMYQLKICPRSGNEKDYRINKKELYTRWIENSPKDKTTISMRRFTIWVKFYVERLYTNVNIIDHIRSNGEDFMVFKQR